MWDQTDVTKLARQVPLAAEPSGWLLVSSCDPCAVSVKTYIVLLLSAFNVVTQASQSTGSLVTHLHPSVSLLLQLSCESQKEAVPVTHVPQVT